MKSETCESGSIVPSHEELDDLETQVQSRLRGWMRDFRLAVRDHGLVLQGQVCSYYAKQLAQHAVMEATPLPIQANDIEVVGGAHG